MPTEAVSVYVLCSKAVISVCMSVSAAAWLVSVTLTWRFMVTMPGIEKTSTPPGTYGLVAQMRDLTTWPGSRPEALGLSCRMA